MPLRHTAPLRPAGVLLCLTGLLLGLADAGWPATPPQEGQSQGQQQAQKPQKQPKQKARPDPRTAPAQPTPGQDQRTLRGADELARVYSAIFDADFDRASRLLEDACPPAPNEACLVLDATRILWRIQMDPAQTRWDDQFTKAVTDAITATDAWSARDKQNPEAWFYLGGAYAARVQFRVLRHESLSAARDGKRIKEALDEALRLEPGLDDGQFGLGLYEYYADVAPTAAKMLRFLLLLPGGDRARGLTRMQRTRDRGVLLGDEASYQLHLIYLWYEHDPTQALALLQQLSVRHPTNPLFWRLIGDVEDGYLHDRTASLATHRSLLDRARTHRVNLPVQAEVEARLGIAREMDALGDTDLAITELTQVLATEPEAPVGAGAEARLELAAANDRIGQRADAERLYREAMASPPVPDEHDVAGRARRGLQRRVDPNKARAYKLSLDGWRLFERGGSATNASLLLEEAIAADPQNVIARYRYGRLLMAQHQNPEALAQMELAANVGASAGATAAASGNGTTGATVMAPAAIVADAALAAGRLREVAQDRPGAIVHYRQAATMFGASSDTRTAARRALTRLEKLDQQ